MVISHSYVNVYQRLLWLKNIKLLLCQTQVMPTCWSWWTVAMIIYSSWALRTVATCGENGSRRTRSWFHERWSRFVWKRVKLYTPNHNLMHCHYFHERDLWLCKLSGFACVFLWLRWYSQSHEITICWWLNHVKPPFPAVTPGCVPPAHRDPRCSLSAARLRNGLAPGLLLRVACYQLEGGCGCFFWDI